jgi:hemolysin activation/secretion protein
VVSGEAVVLDSGSLADAMRATMAFPLAFTGVEKNGQLLMDGGMLMPVPVDIAKGMADDSIPVIAINTTSPLYNTSEELETPVDIAGQVTSIMTADKLRRQLAKADFVITPVPESFSSTDFEDADSLIEQGYRAGLKAADSIIGVIDAGRMSPRYYRSDDNAFIDPTSGAAVNWTHSQESKEFTIDGLVGAMKKLAKEKSVFDVAATMTPEHSQPAYLDAEGRVVSDTSVAVKLTTHLKLSRDEVKIRVIGNRVFEDSTIAARCDFQRALISAEDVRKAAAQIADFYHEQGYDLAEVKDIKIDFEKKTITFVIDEGIIRRIDVADNKRCRDWLIRSYLPLKKGKPYSAAEASEGIASLYGTDLFDRVTLDLSPLDTGALVTVRVKEKENTQLRFGWHWHNMYQSEQFVELLDNNVFGIGMEFLNHAQFGDDRKVFYTGVRIDRIFRTYLTARLRLHYRELDRDLYDVNGHTDGIREEDRWGAGFILGQQIARLGTVSAGITVEEVQLRDRRIGSDDLLGLRTLHLESRVETMDHAEFPTDGENHQAEIRFAGKLIGGDVEFTRFKLSMETYYSFNDFVVYHPHLTLGLSRRGLPPSEKFYAGGAHSFSGFRTSELSGDKMFLFNQEVRFKLPFWLYLSARFDVGDVYGSTEDIKLAKLRQGFGIAAALDTPIGPIELAWGGGDSPKDNLYFNAGFRF